MYFVFIYNIYHIKYLYYNSLYNYNRYLNTYLNKCKCMANYLNEYNIIFSIIEEIVPILASDRSLHCFSSKEGALKPLPRIKVGTPVVLTNHNIESALTCSTHHSTTPIMDHYFYCISAFCYFREFIYQQGCSNIKILADINNYFPVMADNQ